MRQSIFMNRLTGVVLCGGESRRMGRDKGLIERDGVCWAARMGRLLAAFGMPVVYSIRAEQEAAYAAVLPGGGLIVDALEIAGPLNGLFSVQRRFVDRDLLVLACDMQDMDERTIGELIAEYKKGGAEFYVYYEGEFVQPFCAVYTAGGLERVFPILGEERRLRGVIGKGVVRRLEVRKKEAFGNYNSL
jgi:molybdopterin-guanine dinucleotide biosynthesis protein A